MIQRTLLPGCAAWSAVRVLSLADERYRAITATSLGPGDGLDFELLQTSDASFVLLSDFSPLEEMPAEFTRTADGRQLLVIGGEPFGIKN